jgi:hypothetical protein
MSVNLLEFAIGRVFEHICAVEFAGMRIRIVGIRARADRDEEVFTVLSERHISGPVPTAGELRKARNIWNDNLSWA